MGHGEQSQGDQPAGVFELPIGGGSSEMSPFQFDALVMPPTPEGRQAALDSVNSSPKSTAGEFGEQTRQAFADLIGGGKVDRYDDCQLNVPCVSTLLKNDASNHSGLRKLAAQEADFSFDQKVRAA